MGRNIFPPRRQAKANDGQTARTGQTASPALTEADLEHLRELGQAWGPSSPVPAADIVVGEVARGRPTPKTVEGILEVLPNGRPDPAKVADALAIAIANLQRAAAEGRNFAAITEDPRGVVVSGILSIADLELAYRGALNEVAETLPRGSLKSRN